MEITTNGEISALTLQHALLDPLLATDKKQGVVEPFWLVRHEPDLHKSNMEIVSIGVVPGYGFKIAGKPMSTVSQVQFTFPALISKGDVESGTQLAVHWVATGEKPLKKAKLSQ